VKINKTTLIIGAFLTLVAISAIANAQYEDPFANEEFSWGLFGLFAGALCIIPLIIFIIWIILAIWVYKDAQKRGSSGALWLIIVIFTGIIGLIIWLVVRPPIGGETAAESKRMCPNCGRPIPMDARACPYCAKKFEE
jgi:Na+/H+-dicarboxylate symporter